jgi:hypothetical protein
MNAEVRSRFVRPLVRSLLAVLGLALLAAPMPVRADGFPFGRELLLDAAPMRGSKKVRSSTSATPGPPRSSCGATA